MEISNFEVFEKGLEFLRDYGQELGIDEIIDYNNLPDAYMVGYSPSYETIIGIYNDKIKDSPDFLEEEKEIMARFVDMHWNYRIESHYGGENQGREYYTVYYFPTTGTYIKFYGYYQSYHGADYVGCYEVTPQERLITVYEK